MARVCTVTGKKPHFGNTVSHANNKTRRRWQPNLQVCSFPSEILGKMVAIRVTANGVRTIEHKGGLDAWLLSTAPSRLTEAARKVRREMLARTVTSQSLVGGFHFPFPALGRMVAAGQGYAFEPLKV